MTAIGWAQILLTLGVVVLLTKPVGLFMHAVFERETDPLGRAAFDFTTYVEPGKLDPSVEVLVIDYGSVPANPALLIRQIRDELVQVVPGANLGKMLVRVPRRRQLFDALYFALKSEI